MAFSTTLRIARKEFLENVLSWKFLLALVLASLLLSTSVLVLGEGYKEDHKSYSVRVTQMEEEAQQNPWMSTWLNIQRETGRPNVLGIFVGGPGDDLRRQSTADTSGSGTPSGSGVPTNLRFDPLDLGFVAVVVMTFMAVIFSYDSVSGEKERGTLKLMLANPVPKDSVLLGKYLGGMASVLVPFVLALVIGLAFLGVTDVNLVVDDWLRLVAILGLFMLLVSAFFLVGLLVSSLAKRSSTSLLALTLTWLVLVFGAGNVAALAAKETTDTMTDVEMREQFRVIDERSQARSEELSLESSELYEKMWRNNGTLSPEDQARLDALNEEQQKVWQDAQEQREGVIERARRQLDNQLTRAEAIAAVSPAESFRSLATAIAKSDYWTFKEMNEAAEAYQREVDEARRQWEEENGGGGPIIIYERSAESTIGRPEPMPIDPPFPGEPTGEQFQPPPFRYEASSIEKEVTSGSGVRDLLSLIAYNLLAFLGAYAAFLRYDVR